MCGLVTGCDNSSGKEEGSSLQVDLSIVLWKPTDRLGVRLIFGKTNTQDTSKIVWKLPQVVRILHRAQFMEMCTSQDP